MFAFFVYIKMCRFALKWKGLKRDVGAVKSMKCTLRESKCLVTLVIWWSGSLHKFVRPTSLVYSPSRVNTTPMWLNFSSCCSMRSLTCKIRLMRFRKKRTVVTPSFFNDHFCLKISHFKANFPFSGMQMITCPMFVEGPMSVQAEPIVRKMHLSQLTPPSTRLWLIIQPFHTQYEGKWWQHTPLSVSNAHGELLISTLPARTLTSEQECSHHGCYLQTDSSAVLPPHFPNHCRRTKSHEMSMSTKHV